MKTSTQKAVNVSNQVAWKALKNLIERFNLTKEEALKLMGDMPISSYYKGINKFEGNLSRDERERISLLLGIYKDLRILFIDSAQAMSWINRENKLPPFNGITPKKHMMEGSLIRLAEVRRFLDFWRGH
ncbi:antitoxin Xre-like helix-turn-helix domain-containing protein [Legionella sp. CNM-1927-20]|uniref:antitoxin Xre-like helix-turn-helix domain-containing protein n=1 Tax=Legionella sp. CNM-1927-20 TaxID=3422221 RepID=UPI00403AD351